MLTHHSTTLRNGLTVVAVEQPHLHSATVALMVRCGSRHETCAQWGLSHLLEHMLFRGSRNFPESHRLAEVFERAGGTLQAATWRDHTSFSVTLHPSHLEPVLAAKADMIGFPGLRGIDLERSIVEEELRAELDADGADIDLNNLSRASIWHGHPMGRRITGSIESVRNLRVGDLRAYHNKHYTGQNMALCVAGPVPPKQVVALVQKYFEALPAGTRIAAGTSARFAPRASMRLQPREGSQVAMQLSFAALPDTHQDFAAMSLLSSILDDGMTTRLPKSLCDQHGLVYELQSGLDCYADCGVYDVDMQTEPKRCAFAIDMVRSVLSGLCEEGVTEQELTVAKMRHLREMEFSCDSTDEIAQRFAIHALFGRPLSMCDEMAALQAVRLEDVQRVANVLFMNQPAHATLIGPVEKADLQAIEAGLQPDVLAA